MTSSTHRVLGAGLLCGMTLAASAAASAPALASAKAPAPAPAPAKVGFLIAPVGKPSLRFAAVPGQTLTGRVRVENLAARSSQARGRVSVRHLARLALPVRLTVPGPLATRFALTKLHFGVDASGSSLRIGMRNAGNQIIRQTAVELTVTQDGRSLLEIRDEIRDLITGTAIAFPVAWRGELKPGSYRVKGILRPQGGPPVAVDQTVAFTPKLAKTLERKTSRPVAPGDVSPSGSGALAVALTAAGTITVAYVRLRRRLRTASA